jgi:hypothetical protein
MALLIFPGKLREGTYFSETEVGSRRQHKPQGATGIARAVAEYQQAHQKNQNTAAALKTLCAKFGNEAPQQLTRAKFRSCYDRRTTAAN